jgi:two-component system, NtrC family, response regulator HydG
MVSEKKFRPDLLYRINTVEIDLPPLRERKEDIHLLAEHFLTMYKKKYHKPVISFDPVAMRKLEHYNWPGNIRELQHAVERAVILSDAEVLHPSDFYFNQSGSTESLNLDDYNLDEVEKTIIRKVLNKHEGNVSKAAKELGITRTSLYRRMEKYGL